MALGNGGHYFVKGFPMSVAPVEAPQTILNATTRCDACRSRAYVIVILKRSKRLPTGGELLLCAHDYRKHEPALVPYIAQTIDERDQLAEHVKDDHHVT